MSNDKRCDPEMHQIRSGQQWHVGTTMHFALETAAKLHGKHMPPGLLHGNEQLVHGVSLYASQKTWIGLKSP